MHTAHKPRGSWAIGTRIAHFSAKTIWPTPVAGRQSVVRMGNKGDAAAVVKKAAEERV